MAAPPHLSCPPRRRRRRQHLLVSSVVASAASAAAILVALAGLPPPANADSTTIYTRPGVGGAPPTCALPSVKRAAGVASTCPGDRSTASGSPFLVPPAAAAAAAALGYEHEELYTPGGLPPVHVGDTLGDGNYTVVAKLGYGSFSTVWAADHVATGRRVAIKLWRSTGWTTDMADEEHGYLKELAAVDPTAAFPVMRLLDSFVHPSAHGRHQAVVLELMGVSLRVALHAYLHRPGASRRRGAPVRVITTVVRQLLEGLSLAHHHRLLHTDLKLENVALRLPSAAEAAAVAALPPPTLTPRSRRFGRPAASRTRPPAASRSLTGATRSASTTTTSCPTRTSCRRRATARPRRLPGLAHRRAATSGRSGAWCGTWPSGGGCSSPTGRRPGGGP